MNFDNYSYIQAFNIITGTMVHRLSFDLLKRSKTINKSIFIAFIWFVSLSTISAQESKVTINYEGKDVTSLKHAWSAQWITHPTASTLDFNVFLYRRDFQIDEIPESFVIYVSADNRYKLYINGEKVSMGPARSDINHWNYETVDLAKYLQKGNNVLAAEVINFGEFRAAAQYTFQTAFILQGDENNVVNIDTKPNEEWKITQDKAYSFTPFLSDSLGGYYAAGPGDIFDSRLHSWDWKSTNANNTEWVSPRAATVEFAVGRGFLFGSTWYLTPRAIPKMEEKREEIHKVIRTEGIKLSNEVFTSNSSITIPAHTKVSILLDNQNHTIGYPVIEWSEGKDSKIKISYAEALFYTKSKDRKAHGGWKKGPRNDFEDKELRGYYDIVFADGGKNRTFTPHALRTFRFVQLDIETKDEALVIDDFYNVYTAFPFEEKSSFTTKDTTLRKIWDVAWRTLRNSSLETYIDPYYEQLQYVGDSRIQSMVSLYVANDDRLMKKALTSFDHSRLPNGLTASRFPSYIVQVIPTYSLIWIDMINDFYMYRDDSAFLEQFLPGMESVLAWFDRHVDDTGMLANLEWWNFTDWTKGFQNGIPPGADDGHSANVSLQYVYALQNAVPIFEQFGKKELANKYSNQAKRMQNAVLKHCYSNEKGLIAERPEKDVFSQHSNIFALLTDTYSPQNQQEVMTKILEDSTLIQTSIYFKFYLTRALQKTKQGNKYFDLLAPWKYMLSQGMTTFGETDKNPRSDCHGWSATPCFEYLHTIAGIQPTSPSFKTVLIEPNFGNLDDIDVLFAHPKGTITVQLHKKTKQVNGIIILPQGISGRFIYNQKNIVLKEGKNKI